MDILKANFKDAYKQFETILKQASLIAIDLEMTGIRGRPERYCDTADERYSKNREVAQKYRIIQFGITLFVKVSDSYTAYPFNSYVMQDEAYRQGYIGMEVSALQFLTEHGMDFNKWIKEGVAYIGKYDEENLQRDDSHDILNDPIKLHEKKYQEETEKEFELIEKLVKDGKEDRHFIPTANSYIRKYYHQQIANKYPNYVLEKAFQDKIEGIVMRKPLSLQEKEEMAKIKEQENWNKVGFRNVFKAICNSHLPIVGHNCFYDFLFLYCSFEEQPPESLLEYKTAFAKLFIETYDTKYMVCDKKVNDITKLFYQDTILETIYGHMLKQEFPKITIAACYDKYSKGSSCHEAGYDSYITGYSFLKMAYILKDDFKKYKGMINCHNGTFIYNMYGTDFIKNDTFVVTSSDEKYLAGIYKKIEIFKDYATIRMHDEKNAIFVVFDQCSPKGQEELLEFMKKDTKLKIGNWQDYSDIRLMPSSDEDKSKHHFRGNKNRKFNKKDK